MKRLSLFCLLLFLAFSQATAQYATIPDPAFRAFLVKSFPSCFNAEEKMDTTCFNVTIMSTLYVPQANIQNLDGVQYFDNLQTFQCAGNLLSYGGLRFKLPRTLKKLELINCGLSELPALPPDLIEFRCNNNQLNALPSSLPSKLVTFDCSYNYYLKTLPPLPATITRLDCAHNRITSLPSLPDGLQYLDCSSNNITVLPTLPAGLPELKCASNQLTVLPILPNSLLSIDCSHNLIPQLPSLPSRLSNLSSSNNQLFSLPSLPASLVSLWVGYNSLTQIPTLPLGLRHLNVQNNLLKALPVLPDSVSYLVLNKNQLSMLPPLPKVLNQLFCDSNLLTSLPELPTQNLTLLTCVANKLKELPLLPDTLRDIWCMGNQLQSISHLPRNLHYFQCNDNNLSYLPSLPPNVYSFFCFNNPNLLCLPRLSEALTILGISEGTIKCLPNHPAGLNVYKNTTYEVINLPLCTSSNPDQCMLVTDLDESERREEALVYPNPAHGVVLVKVTDTKSLKLFDSTAKLRLQTTVSGSQELALDHLPSGLYFYEIGKVKGKLLIE